MPVTPTRYTIERGQHALSQLSRYTKLKVFRNSTTFTLKGCRPYVCPFTKSVPHVQALQSKSILRTWGGWIKCATLLDPLPHIYCTSRHARPKSRLIVTATRHISLPFLATARTSNKNKNKYNLVQTSVQQCVLPHCKTCWHVNNRSQRGWRRST